MIILKQYVVKIDDQKKKLIQREIASQENINEGINEQEIDRLYRVYGKGIPKKEFIVDILELSQEEWVRGQKTGKQFFILRKYSRKQKIKQELINNGHAGEKWNSKECEKFYHEKGIGIPEIEFYIDVFEVSKSNIKQCKQGRYNMTILKLYAKRLTEKEKKAIQKEIAFQEDIEKRIDKEKSEELYQKYGRGMPKKEFMQDILEINDEQWIKMQEGEEIFILRKYDRKQKIKEELVKKGHAGERWNARDYFTFKKIKGQGLTDVEIAEDILEVRDVDLYECKQGRYNIIILKSCAIIIEETKKKEIKQEIIVGKITEGNKKPQEIEELYQKYGRGMPRKEFIQDILEVSDEEWVKMEQGEEIFILRYYLERKKIISKLEEEGHVGKYANKDIIRSLYQQYGNGIGIAKFALDYLGVEEDNLRKCLYYDTNVLIKNGILYQRTTFLRRNEIEDGRFYSLEEISNICEKYDITLDDFIIYIIQKGKFYDTTPYTVTLYANAKLWIGKVQASKEFINENINTIKTEVKKVVSVICKKYEKSDLKEDYIQDAIVYVISFLGELEKNFSTNQDFLKEQLRRRCSRYIEEMLLKNLIKDGNIKSFYEVDENDEEYEIVLPDKTVNVQDEVEEKVIREQIAQDKVEKCIKLLSECLIQGMDRMEAVKEINKQLNISAEEMLTYMRQYLIQKEKMKEMREGYTFDD